MPIKIKQITSIPDFIDAIRLRVNVFIIEQGFKAGWEPDEDDKLSVHFIGLDGSVPVATARVRQIAKSEYKIERMVVCKEYRERGVGKALLEHILGYLFALKPRKIWLRSQVKSMEFYKKCGFKEISEPFDMFGMQHIDMEYESKLE